MATPSKSRINSTTPRYELWQIRLKPSVNWRSHVLVTGNPNSTSSSGELDAKTSAKAALALFACW
ncbi:MAG: hypothetical protein V4724_18885 [Pseudomonadota bacterium]